MEYIGHKSEDGRKQPLLEHLTNTAILAESFADVLNAGEWGRICGLYHDIGKYSPGFQRRILANGPKVDHSTAGAKEMAKLKKIPLAMCIAGHHSGLLNLGNPLSLETDTLMGRLKKELSGTLDYSAFKTEVSDFQETLKIPTCLRSKDPFSISFFIRMLFSCLVDADFLDTEAFMQEGAIERGGFSTISELQKRFMKYYKRFSHPTTPINKKRREIFLQCTAKAAENAPLWGLTVPTGGGKTLASMAFALNHAVQYGKKRIIYVIPYTSIIEQTAAIFRDIVGEDNVIEHHMNVDYGGSEEKEDFSAEKKKLATENWDAPLIVTTNVQFFESLYASRTSRCRKLHNIAESVIVFDEAQMLPNDYLKPCVHAIAELVSSCKCTAVLCTATQPSIDSFFTGIDKTLTVREIYENTQELYDFFKRVEFERLNISSLGDLVQKVNNCKQALCVANSKKDVQAIYGALSDEGCFHLSTNMYPLHRKKILTEIKKRLRENLPCKVISTSLIECGVDLDFPTVFRELAGIDNIIQAGGRCNREGKRGKAESKVYVYDLNKKITEIPTFIRLPIEVTKMVMQKHADISSVEAIKEYFDLLHSYKDESLDKKGILETVGKYNFRNAAHDFVLIEENTKNILIDSDSVSHNIISDIRLGIRNRHLMRKAAMYTVQVYERAYKKLLETGKIEIIDENINVLLDENIYDIHMGLIVDESDGIGLFL
ncbi:CRISPR-associated helicase Cas3' [Colibacter massiliensis]|uniref:CRISPR-associated helicase Cas3' n=1 Tax=Colibacter massiliensis TaxID=1852379 RepID=UPI003F8E5117